MSSFTFKDGSAITKSGISAVISKAAAEQFDVAKRAVVRHFLADTDEVWDDLPLKAELFKSKAEFEAMLAQSTKMAVASLFLAAGMSAQPNQGEGSGIITP